MLILMGFSGLQIYCRLVNFSKMVQKCIAGFVLYYKQNVWSQQKSNNCQIETFCKQEEKVLKIQKVVYYCILDIKPY
jgi:hypothetical protein